MTDTPTSTPTETETTTDIEDGWTTDQPDQQEEETSSAPAESNVTAGIDPRSETIRRYLAWGGLGVCSLLAVFALIRFYGSVGATIDLWVDPKYQPVIRAAFNLAVLLTSLIGVSLLVRELSGESD
ncbi:hypothetical protein [Natrinema salsiterrestre]|uniref:DUF8060 domain-containing protein n=1 Tax=Natrinema salsiterrestre TaxID=2950540 RepID=A0A9Q4KWU3_9EURY|nr:hypothetical protein [Natrinema salsiterrestre]MDF9744460.1 hypothetical protein [Natrinema salsiterrestre]